MFVGLGECKVHLMMIMDHSECQRLQHASIPKGPVTQPITHESLTNHAQIGFVRACASRNREIFGVSAVEITDE